MMHLGFAFVSLVTAHVDPASGEPPTDAPPPAEPEAPLVPEEPTLEQPAPATETIVRTRRPRTAASASTVRDRDFMLRPHLRSTDILSTVPGLFVVQHSGGGKANQLFLRGFDADHGTDVLLTVDGVPVNKPSHGHGQGYADLHFVIPELVKRVDVKKGPYFADVGDFGTAGAIDLVTVPHIDQSRVSVGSAGFLTDDITSAPLRASRALVMVTPDVAGAHPFFAGEVFASDGPFENPERLKRFNLFARAPIDLGEAGRVVVTAMSYGAGWNASNQMPARAVKAGTLDRFGAVDPSDGGNAQRHGVVARFDRGDENESLMLTGFLTHDRLNLFSNFTFFSVNPMDGDQIEQVDARNIMGLHGRYATSRSWGPLVLDTRVGIQVRNDLIDNALFETTERERRSQSVGAKISQGSIGLYAEQEASLPPAVRLILGARADGFGFQVEDTLEDTLPDAANGGDDSGVSFASAVSPKASLILTWPDVVELYLNSGMGFHSNDARGVTSRIDPATPLTRALGYEVGARTRLFDTIDLAGAAFGLDLDGETVWVGDEGTNELRGATRRLGLELDLRANLGVDWLYFDLDATTTSAVFTGLPSRENAVALAPTTLVTTGLSVYDLAGFFGRVGVTHVADRPATEDRFLVAEGFTRVDAALGWRAETLEVALDVANLTNAVYREAQFANVSRLAGEASPAACTGGTRAVVEDGSFMGCEDVHFTPGAPLSATLTATLKF